MNAKVNIDIKSIVSKVLIVLQKLHRYVVIIFIVIIFSMYSFLVLRINSLASREPSEEEVTMQLLSVKRLRIDQSAVDKILQLQDNNVGVKALFDQYRDNPFQE